MNNKYGAGTDKLTFANSLKIVQVGMKPMVDEGVLVSYEPHLHQPHGPLSYVKMIYVVEMLVLYRSLVVHQRKNKSCQKTTGSDCERKNSAEQIVC